MRAHIAVLLLPLVLAGCAEDAGGPATPPGASLSVSPLLPPTASVPPAPARDPAHPAACREVDAPDVARERAAVAAGEDTLHVFGGRDGNGRVTSEVLRVDPDSGEARVVAHLSVARMGIAVARHGESYYLFGGFTEIFGGRGGGVTTGIVERWTPGSERVEVLDVALDPPRGQALAVSDGERIHLIGGDTGMANLDEILVFDPPALDLASASVRLPEAHSLVAGAWSGASIYLVGGRGNDARDDASILRYTPALEQIVVEPARMPAPMHGAAAAWDGDALVLFGGHEQTRAFADAGPSALVARYDPGEPLAREADLPEPRLGAGAARLGEKLFLLGGATEDGMATTMRVCPSASGR